MRGASSRRPRPGQTASAASRGASPSRGPIQLPYSPFPKQKLFHDCDAEVVLFGGSAGPGKSLAMLMDALVFCLLHPGVTAMLMRRTFPELEKSLIKRALELFPEEVGRYNDAKHRWTIFTGPGCPDSYMEFGHCEREKDVYANRSAEWQYLGLDESTSFSKDMFDELFSRVRSTIPGVRARVRMCSNPGNLGHGWHKEFFGIGRDDCPPSVTWRPPVKEGDKYPPPSRCFIPATIFDNPALIDNDPGYLARLEGLKEAKKRMLLYGEWGGYAGQFFTEYDHRRHLITPFPIPSHWRRFRSVDWGFQKPFSCHWYAVDERGHAYVYREVYRTGLRDREQARAIRAASTVDKTLETYEFTVGDPTMCNRGSTDTGVTAQQNYQAEGVLLFPGSNKRKPGWAAVREWLSVDPATGQPWLQIFDTCPELVRELEEALRDESDPEDIDSDCSDHAIDDLRYWAMARPGPAEALKMPDERAKLDPASRQEWDSVAALQRKHSAEAARDRATLHGLNEG